MAAATVGSMTSEWPWMQGGVADGSPFLDPPIAPVTEFDKRPSVADLIAEHRAKIDKLQSSLQENPLYDPKKHDDLFLLRFLLSHRKTKAAWTAVVKTLEFRKEYQLDEKDIRKTPPHEAEIVLTHFPDGKYPEKGVVRMTCPHVQRGVVAFALLARMDHARAVKEVSQEDLMKIYVYLSEWTFQHLDFVTRMTGRMTKSLRIIDLANGQLRNFNMEYQRREGKIARELADFYPQVLEGSFVVNAPGWFQVTWAVVSPLLPHRLRSKVEVLDPKGKESHLHKILGHVDLADFPSYLGGKREKDYFADYFTT